MQLQRWSRTASASRHRGAGEPYLPVLAALGGLARQPSGRPLVPLLARQAPTWVAQMPWLLSDDELETVHRRLIGATHERMLREMLETLEAISRELTLVLVLEDLHWCDPSTVDLLDALARRREPARLLVVGTYQRSDAVRQDHRSAVSRANCRGAASVPRSPLVLSAERPSRSTSRHDSAPTRRPTSPDYCASAQAVTRCFVTSLLDSWLERELLEVDNLDIERLTGDVPDTVRELIEQMLEQLDPSDRDLLAAASAIGQEFSVAAAAAAVAFRGRRGRAVRRARARGTLRRAGRRRAVAGQHPRRSVRFGHDLHREVTLRLLRRRARRSAGESATAWSRIPRSTEEMAAELADHFVRAGDAARAVPSLRLAAEQAVERLAHREALDHVDRVGHDRPHPG